MPYLSKILIFPIKSLSGVEVAQAQVLPGGAIAHDREFAIFDEAGKVVNSKRTAAVHSIRSSFDVAARLVKLWVEGKEPKEFHLDTDRSAIETWLSQHFGYRVYLQQNLHMGFPDDIHASGPTVVSSATLETVASWFANFSLEEVRDRFRTNLEVSDTLPFWEDQLFTESDQIVQFQVGEVLFEGINPCQRCIVPTRHPITGDKYPEFQKQFSAKRSENLPSWANSTRFNHFYRLTTNTRIPASEAGKILRINDEIKALNIPESRVN